MFSATLVYEHDIEHCYDSMMRYCRQKWTKTQFKEVLSVGLSYKF